ncbi:MAG: hypothetical protein PVI30_25160 [Myxococcales bacterium]
MLKQFIPFACLVVAVLLSPAVQAQTACVEGVDYTKDATSPLNFTAGTLTDFSGVAFRPYGDTTPLTLGGITYTPAHAGEYFCVVDDAECLYLAEGCLASWCDPIESGEKIVVPDGIAAWGGTFYYQDFSLYGSPYPRAQVTFADGSSCELNLGLGGGYDTTVFLGFLRDPRLIELSHLADAVVDNVYTVSGGGSCSIDSLEADITALDQTYEQGLLAKVLAAQAMIERGKTVPAANQLGALMQMLDAKRGNPLDPALVDDLLACIDQVLGGL